MNQLRIRFYEELNDFLPGARRKREFTHRFQGSPSVKDLIESLGVPHTEIDIILINGESVDFAARVNDGDRVSVYPVFESLDVTPLVRLRPKPLRDTRFVLDVHLGRLARNLRLLGFDTLYRNDYTAPRLAAISTKEKRIILTRDRNLLKRSGVTHAHWVRSDDATEQAREVIARFDLGGAVKPFTRCLSCNGPLEPVAKEDVLDRLEPLTRKHYDAFLRCTDCDHVYWRGSHADSLDRLIERIISRGQNS
jgi:uncharacterized protein with PIN domain